MMDRILFMVERILFMKKKPLHEEKIIFKLEMILSFERKGSTLLDKKTFL